MGDIHNHQSHRRRKAVTLAKAQEMQRRKGRNTKPIEIDPRAHHFASIPDLASVMQDGMVTRHTHTYTYDTQTHTYDLEHN